VETIDLDALAEAASSLDPLPASVIRLAAMVASGDPDLTEIAEIVAYDQALTVGLLRSANSSWSASRTPITTVRDAIVRLGYGTVLSLALGVNVRRRMSRALPAYGLAEGELWRHSVAAALTAENLPRHTKVRLPAEVVTAALLHDVGKLVMTRFLDDEVIAVLSRAESESGMSRRRAETELLGVHHGELGGMIVQAWGLPTSITEGISYHHDPDQHPTSLCYGVHIADVVAKSVGAGVDDNADPEANIRALEALRMTPADLDALRTVVAERFEEVIERY